jgi:hypothetical protein
VRVLLRYDFQPLKNKGIELDPEESWAKLLEFRPVVGDVIRSGKAWPQGRLELEVKKAVVDDPYLELQLDVTGDTFWVDDADGCKRLTWTEWYARLRAATAPPGTKTPPGPSDCPLPPSRWWCPALTRL